MPPRIVDASKRSQTLRLENGSLVRLEVEDDLTEVRAFDAQGRQIGAVSFVDIGIDRCGSYFKLGWVYLDKFGARYTHQGLGRAALRLWNSYSDQAAAVERRIGIPDKQDNPAGNAPGFIAKMVEEGLLYYERA